MQAVTFGILGISALHSRNASPVHICCASGLKAKLAGAETEDPRARRAVQDAFVAGYRVVVLMGAALAMAGAVSAAFLIDADRRASS